MENNFKLKAVRVPGFDMVGDKEYGDRPYGVCLDVYDLQDNFIESGTDWSYFETIKEAEDYCLKYNLKKTLNGYDAEFVKDYFLNTGVPGYDQEPYKSYTDEDWVDLANEYDLE